MCISRMGTETVKLVLCSITLHCSDKHEIHVHAQAMKYEWCNVADSMHELNVLIFAFINDTVQYKNE